MRHGRSQSAARGEIHLADFTFYREANGETFFEGKQIRTATVRERPALAAP